MTQQQFVKKQLLEYGKVSRNDCLKRYITRLGALILNLKKEGWEINGYYQDTEYGKDYIYELKHSPLKKVIYKVPTLGLEIESFQ